MTFMVSAARLHNATAEWQPVTPFLALVSDVESSTEAATRVRRMAGPGEVVFIDKVALT